MSEQKSNARTLVGEVVSDKMNKTAVVLISRLVKHQRYGKFIKRSTRLNAHDDMGCAIGDKVKIMETKPMSKTKFWQIVERL